ncbi:unnamed protein product [Paramecium pentaurelia]|uniref:Uncharacterized protein n=1 Tax=Paramecium pentaurelia TaxID=43138 RepID=A0A8S1YI02_9CILI|nr:unnamed protein product [Paramecium pentaurelia]
MRCLIKKTRYLLIIILQEIAEKQQPKTNYLLFLQMQMKLLKKLHYSKFVFDIIFLLNQKLVTIKIRINSIKFSTFNFTNKREIFIKGIKNGAQNCLQELHDYDCYDKPKFSTLKMQLNPLRHLNMKKIGMIILNTQRNSIHKIPPKYINMLMI